MTVTLQQSTLPSWLDTPSAISSPGSADGASPCNLQAGLPPDLSGQEARRASRSLPPEGTKERMMPDTFGRSSSTSFASANLQRSLESRLQQRLDTAGSMIYELTWKTAVTPQQWSYSRLAASARPTKENGCSSWVTPNTRDWKDTKGQRIKSQNPDGSDRHRLDQLPRQVFNLLPAEMDNGEYSHLNHCFSLWLMGYPIGWAFCGEQVTQSSRKSGRK